MQTFIKRQLISIIIPTFKEEANVDELFYDSSKTRWKLTVSLAGWPLVGRRYLVRKERNADPF
jgi:hypothetical protein